MIKVELYGLSFACIAILAKPPTVDTAYTKKRRFSASVGKPPPRMTSAMSTEALFSRHTCVCTWGFASITMLAEWGVSSHPD